MRKMVTHSGDMYGCIDDARHKRKHSERWNKDDCTVCKCKVSFAQGSICLHEKTQLFHDPFVYPLSTTDFSINSVHDKL